MPNFPNVRCEICEQYPTNKTLISCGHYFCFGCLKIEAQKSNRCPTCGKSWTACYPDYQPESLPPAPNQRLSNAGFIFDHQGTINKMSGNNYENKLHSYGHEPTKKAEKITDKSPRQSNTRDVDHNTSKLPQVKDHTLSKNQASYITENDSNIDTPTKIVSHPYVNNHSFHTACHCGAYHCIGEPYFSNSSNINGLWSVKQGLTDNRTNDEIRRTNGLTFKEPTLKKNEEEIVVEGDSEGIIDVFEDEGKVIHRNREALFEMIEDYKSSIHNGWPNLYDFYPGLPDTEKLRRKIGAEFSLK